MKRLFSWLFPGKVHARIRCLLLENESILRRLHQERDRCLGYQVRFRENRAVSRECEALRKRNATLERQRDCLYEHFVVTADTSMAVYFVLNQIVDEGLE
jgi:hypothetical protein